MGINEILAKLNCRKSLVEEIQYMIDHPSERVEMGNRSRAMIEAEYLLKNVSTQYESLYDQCSSSLAASR